VLAKHRLADRGSALPDRGGDEIPVHVIGAGTSRSSRHRSNRHPIDSGDENARVEHAQDGRTSLQPFLQCRGIAQHGRNNSSLCVFFQRVDAGFQLFVDALRGQGRRRKLLFPELLLHVALQHPAGIERQHPNAEHQDAQGEQRDPGLERAPLKNPRAHCDDPGCRQCGDAVKPATRRALKPYSPPIATIPAETVSTGTEAGHRPLAISYSIRLGMVMSNNGLPARIHNAKRE
jgi:hypothetical protein